MKKQAYTLMIFIFSTLAAIAQNDAISNYFSEYEDREDVTTVVLSAKAFELVSQIQVDDEELEEYKNMAAGITGLRLIADENDPNAMATAEEAVNRLPSKFEELMTVKEKDMHLKMLVDEEAGTVYELITVVGSENNFVIMSLVGEMRMKDLGKLTAQMMKAGSSAFAEMEKYTGNLKIYPNPVGQNEEVTIELSEEWTGKQVRVFNAGGVEIEAFTAREGRNAVRVGNWEPGVYLVKATDGSKEVSGKFIVRR